MNSKFTIGASSNGELVGILAAEESQFDLFDTQEEASAHLDKVSALWPNINLEIIELRQVKNGHTRKCDEVVARP